MTFDEKLKEAVNIYGAKTVDDVTSFVELFDADGAYVTFKEESMFDHAECLSMLYYED